MIKKHVCLLDLLVKIAANQRPFYVFLLTKILRRRQFFFFFFFTDSRDFAFASMTLDSFFLLCSTHSRLGNRAENPALAPSW